MDLDQVYRGECANVLSNWPTGWADLIFADPPFNIGYAYDVYKDKKPHDEYYAWTVEWMTACKHALKPTGSFYIAIGDDYAAEVRIIGQKLGLTLRNWIIWHYTFGQNTQMKFSRSHTHIFYFVCDPKAFTFNDREIRYPSARHTVYKDRRGNPLGRLPDDTWNEYPRVCGTFKERAGWHGCQMPEGLLSRIIRTSSKEDDTVLDPFAGSGTTLATAAKLGRHFVGIDISPQYVQQCQMRVKDALRVREESTNHKPANELDWPTLHEEALVQLYRELYRDTPTPTKTLEAVKPAMECFLECLKARTGKDYKSDIVIAKLRELARAAVLPPIAAAPRSNGKKDRTNGRKG